MNKNLKEEIISKAKNLILNDGKIKAFYFFPGFISIIFLTVTLFYQAIYSYLELFGNQDKALELILEVMTSRYVFLFVVIFFVFLFFYMILVPMFEGGMIWYISKKSTTEEHISRSEVLSHGLFRFLQFFEYSNLFSQFKIMTLLNAYLFCLRFIGVKYIEVLSIVFICFFFLFLVINVLFLYAKYEVVLNDKSAFEAIVESVKIAIINLGFSLQMYSYVFFLNIKVIFNFLLFLIFPIIIASAITYITTQFLLIITVIFVSILFLCFIFFLGYGSGVLEIYKTAILYYSYIECKKNVESE